MMMNKRLIGTVPESKKYIAGNVALQWCSLAANIAMMATIASLLSTLQAGAMTSSRVAILAAVTVVAVLARYLCTLGASKMSYLSAQAVKKTLRDAIYQKLLRLGASYAEQVGYTGQHDERRHSQCRRRDLIGIVHLTYEEGVRHIVNNSDDLTYYCRYD